MRIKNLTPFVINLLDKNDKVIKTFESDGVVELQSVTVNAGKLGDIPLTKEIITGVIGLPDVPGEFYIVPKLLKYTFPKRDNLLITSEEVWAGENMMVGCRSFELVSEKE